MYVIAVSVFEYCRHRVSVQAWCFKATCREYRCCTNPDRVLQEAVELYGRALEARPTAEAHYNLATLLLNQKGMKALDDASVHLEAAVQLKPQHEHAQATLRQVAAMRARKGTS